VKDNGRRIEPGKNITVADSVQQPQSWFRDGQTLLILSSQTGNIQMYRLYLDGRNLEAIAPSRDDQGDPQITPDGAWILYWSSPAESGARISLLRVPVKGGTPEKVVDEAQDTTTYLRCPTRADSSCVLSLWKQNALIFYEFDALKGQGKEVVQTSLEQPKNLLWSLSPSGARIAIASRDLLKEQVRIVDLHGGGETTIALPKGWVLWDMDWKSDETSLLASLYSFMGAVVEVHVDGKTNVLIQGGKSDFFYAPRFSPDGKYLAYGKQEWNANVWLLENF
jgi:hypothetical protein